MTSRNVQWLQMCLWSWHLKEWRGKWSTGSPYNHRGRQGQKYMYRQTDTHTPRVPRQSSGQGQGFGEARPEPGLGAGVGVVADSDEPQDAGELFLHCLVLDRDQSLLMSACKPRGAELAPGPRPRVGWDQSLAQGLTALPQVSIPGTHSLTQKALMCTHKRQAGVQRPAGVPRCCIHSPWGRKAGILNPTHPLFCGKGRTELTWREAECKLSLEVTFLALQVII